MYKPFCLFCSFFLMASITGVFGQNSTVDSLVKALSEQKFENKTKVNLLNQLAITVYKEDSTKAYKYADDALNLAKLLDYKHGIAESLWVFANSQYIYLITKIKAEENKNETKHVFVGIDHQLC